MSKKPVLTRSVAGWVFLLLAALAALLAGSACDDDDDNDNNDTSDDDDDNNDDNDADDDDDDDDNDDDDTSPGEYWNPHSVIPIEVHPPIRGLTVQRGIIHIHSVYSHDACDNMPFIGGHPNWNCFWQLRDAMCDNNEQYVMLTDHAEPFAEHEFPDVLLYQPDEGDELLYEDSAPVGNRITCDDGNVVTLAVGNENHLMPIGLKRMPDGTPDERIALLRGSDEATVQGLRALGANVFVAHAEGWEPEELAALSVEGLEIYQLHANIDPSIREEFLGLPALGFVWPLLHFLFDYANAGNSELVILTFLYENRPSLDNWDYLLSQRRAVGTMATDAHRNSLPFPLWDGDRTDSYRRMMHWFANYVLVNDFTLDDYRDAIAGGRMFGAFQVFGEPVGFDFRADTAKGTAEMGDEVPLADDPVIEIVLPTLYNLDPSWPAAEIRAKLIKAEENGGDVVAESVDQNISFTVDEPGAYRAELSIVPYHLESELGDNADWFIREYPFIYANPIYVTD
jgi:hypothetical protein